MIYQVTGKVQILDSKSIVVESSGGVGYLITVADSSKFARNESVMTVYTSFQVREDSQALYGFKSVDEKGFFEKLISVSGIGPKVAISILSTYSINEIHEFILSGDFKNLSKVSGLGQKGAKKIIIDLQSKLSSSIILNDNENLLKNSDKVGDLRVHELKTALSSLGFKGSELVEMVEMGEGFLSINNSLTLEQLIQRVLKG